MNVSRKVRYGSVTSAVTGLVTWLLVSYVFHGDLPAPVTTVLPFLVAVALGWATAWGTKHAPQDLRAGISSVVRDYERVSAQLQAIQPMNLPPAEPVVPPVNAAGINAGAPGHTRYVPSVTPSGYFSGTEGAPPLVEGVRLRAPGGILPATREKK